jgi:hypothetical protein
VCAVHTKARVRGAPAECPAFSPPVTGRVSGLLPPATGRNAEQGRGEGLPALQQQRQAMAVANYRVAAPLAGAVQVPKPLSTHPTPIC